MTTFVQDSNPTPPRQQADTLPITVIPRVLFFTFVNEASLQLKYDTDYLFSTYPVYVSLKLFFNNFLKDCEYDLVVVVLSP